MKFFYVKAKQTFSISPLFIKKMADKLPEKIGIVTTLQFSDIAKKIFLILKEKKKKVFLYKKGVILGCNLEAAKKIEKKVEAFLYVGSGNFHPMMLALSLKKEKPIFIFNPNTSQFYELSKKEVEKFKKRREATRILFLHSENVGIFVSTKRGQMRLREALKIKRQLEKRGKKVYIFLGDNFAPEQLENWPEMIWINTACPGLSLEQNLLDLSIVKKVLKDK